MSACLCLSDRHCCCQCFVLCVDLCSLAYFTCFHSRVKYHCWYCVGQRCHIGSQWCHVVGHGCHIDGQFVTSLVCDVMLLVNDVTLMASMSHG